jgi:hypothetical protein
VRRHMTFCHAGSGEEKGICSHDAKQGELESSSPGRCQASLSRWCWRISSGRALLFALGEEGYVFHWQVDVAPWLLYGGYRPARCACSLRLFSCGRGHAERPSRRRLLIGGEAPALSEMQGETGFPRKESLVCRLHPNLFGWAQEVVLLPAH